MTRPPTAREALGCSPLVKAGGANTPRVSNVFQRWPQVQDHTSSWRGDQPQSGHRMRGPEGSTLFSRSRSRSATTDWSSKRAHILAFLGLALIAAASKLCSEI